MKLWSVSTRGCSPAPSGGHPARAPERPLMASGWAMVTWSLLKNNMERLHSLLGDATVHMLLLVVVVCKRDVLINSAVRLSDICHCLNGALSTRAYGRVTSQRHLIRCFKWKWALTAAAATQHLTAAVVVIVSAATATEQTAREAYLQACYNFNLSNLCQGVTFI